MLIYNGIWELDLVSALSEPIDLITHINSCECSNNKFTWQSLYEIVISKNKQPDIIGLFVHALYRLKLFGKGHSNFLRAICSACFTYMI